MNNPTHHFYKTLVETNSALLQELEQAVAPLSPEEASERLPHLIEHPAPLPETLDYDRLFALLRKDFRGYDLRGEDFSEMPLAGFDFTHAQLQGALMHRAVLKNACLDCADCSDLQASTAQMQQVRAWASVFRNADLSGADLTGADLNSADLTEANLSEAHLNEASCSYSRATRIQLRYANLIKSAWSHADLTGACMGCVNATEASFAEARLDYADVSDAILRSAILASTSCCSSNFAHSDLQGGFLYHAHLDFANLEGSDLQGTDLSSCFCDHASFGRRWSINPQTRIDSNNHALIGMALLSEARTVEQQPLALYVRYQTSMCWSGFLHVLLRQSKELAIWGKEVLKAIESLRRWVEDYEEVFDRLLHERQDSLDLSALPPQIQARLLAEIEQQRTLTNPQLYWYLCGWLSMVSREMALDESQRQEVIMQLRRLTKMEE